MANSVSRFDVDEQTDDTPGQLRDSGDHCCNSVFPRRSKVSCNRDSRYRSINRSILQKSERTACSAKSSGTVSISQLIKSGHCSGVTVIRGCGRLSAKVATVGSRSEI